MTYQIQYSTTLPPLLEFFLSSELVVQINPPSPRWIDTNCLPIEDKTAEKIYNSNIALMQIKSNIYSTAREMMKLLKSPKFGAS